MKVPVIAALVVATAFLAPVVVAHGNAYHINLETVESGCTGVREFCFEVMSGTLADLTPGDTLEVTFWNEGSRPHELWITTLEDSDPRNQDSSTGQAIEGTGDPVDPGRKVDLIADIPVDATGVYLWCNIGDHESIGMWIRQEFEGAAGEEDGGQAPSVGMAGLLSALAAAFAFARQRESRHRRR